MPGERCDLRWDRARHARCPERSSGDAWLHRGVLIGTIQRHECRNDDLRPVFREFTNLGVVKRARLTPLNRSESTCYHADRRPICGLNNSQTLPLVGAPARVRNEIRDGGEEQRRCLTQRFSPGSRAVDTSFGPCGPISERSCVFRTAYHPTTRPPTSPATCAPLPSPTQRDTWSHSGTTGSTRPNGETGWTSRGRLSETSGCPRRGGGEAIQGLHDDRPLQCPIAVARGPSCRA